MPEPVVIIGPASGPAGPIPGQPDQVASSAHAAADRPEDRATVVPRSRGVRILRAILSILGRVCWVVGTMILTMFRRYPRHSLAAAASVLILGGIFYSQTRSANPRRDVTTAITGKPSSSADDTKAPAAQPKPDDASGHKPDVAAAPKPTGSDQEKAAAAKALDPSRSETITTAAAQTEAAPRSNLPAPKADEARDSAAPASSLAQSVITEKQAGHPDEAPAPAPPASTNIAVLPLPATGSEPVKATLLEPAAPTPIGSAAAPGSSLAKNETNGSAGQNASSQTGAVAQAPSPAAEAGQSAASKQKSDAPDDLWVPEGAPIAGAGASQPAQAGLAAASPAPDGPGKPLEESKKAEGHEPKPTDPAPKPATDSVAGPVPLPRPEASVPQIAAEQKPVAAPAETVVPKTEKTKNEEPIAAPKTDAAARAESAPARPTQEPVSKPHDPDTSGPAPTASPTVVGGELTAPRGEPARGNPGDDRVGLPAAGGTTPRSIATGEPPTEPTRHASTAKDASDPGWVSIPNSGTIPLDAAGDSDEGATGSRSERAAPISDVRAHTARDGTFEPESSPSQKRESAGFDSSGSGGRSAVGSPKEARPRAASHAERVEATDHLVERGENYWTISRQYYNSGRYYRALWKANQSKYPDINTLHVGDLIVVPAIEDLDPDYILSARARAPSASLASAAAPGGRGQEARRDDETGTTPDASSSRSSGVPAPARVSRASLADSDLDLPTSAGGPRRDRTAPYKGRSPAAAGVFDGDADEPETRTAARPRGTGSATPGRPVYRVRSYDTLRSIARDTLGDARRADEILELNRGLIDNPTQLVTGQVLELPEDARTSLRRSASRR